MADFHQDDSGQWWGVKPVSRAPLCYACGQPFPEPTPQKAKVCEECGEPWIPKNYRADTRCVKCHEAWKWVK